jgi:hypothetical protein
MQIKYLRSKYLKHLLENELSLFQKGNCDKLESVVTTFFENLMP